MQELEIIRSLALAKPCNVSMKGATRTFPIHCQNALFTFSLFFNLFEIVDRQTCHIHARAHTHMTM